VGTGADFDLVLAGAVRALDELAVGDDNPGHTIAACVDD
jgi:hypothetical protein